MSCFNLYRPPLIVHGDPAKADKWLDHIKTIYHAELDHIVKWNAHRVQRPQEKINHALVAGGLQGIGKDTMMEPVKHAVGPWNFVEVTPLDLFERFNGYVKSVILRISEARDLGDVSKFSFYDRTKGYLAAPPDVLRCNESPSALCAQLHRRLHHYQLQGRRNLLACRRSKTLCGMER